jgi:hypothetical protein
MKIKASFTGSAGGSPALNAQRSKHPSLRRRVAAVSADGVVLVFVLSAQRLHAGFCLLDTDIIIL